MSETSTAAGTGRTSGSDPVIRPFRDTDLGAVYDICIRTADGGEDATGQFTNDDLWPDIFAGPYVFLEPDLAFVLDDRGRAVGYVLGTADTERFVRAYRERWLPRLRHRYPELKGEPQNREELFVGLHYNPERMLVPELADYPAHLHIDLLPAYQGAGHGRRLMDAAFAALAAKGVTGVHLGVSPTNTKALAFYERIGFRPIDVPGAEGVVFLGRGTEPSV